MTELGREKQRIASLGRRHSMETKIRIGMTSRGRKMPESAKEKLRKLYKGKPRPSFAGEKNPNWKGGNSSSGDNQRRRVLLRMERLAGRKKPSSCELCGAMGAICFDHDHATGNFRGWICTRCNMTLGFVRDNTKLLNDMIKYLEGGDSK